MEVIPAIDLRNNKCVRLYQGDYRQETVFSEDPEGIALHWQAQGASRLHLVDLDGAASGKLQHLDMIRRIARAVRVPIQAGGGIRQLETIRQLLEAGVQRVILGTAAVEDLQFVREACKSMAEAIIISLDARDGYIATHGWQEKSSLTPLKLLQNMTALGARRFIYTDIHRDGTLTQPNFEAIASLVSQTDHPIIASGGISSTAHLRQLARLGVEGAILGRALYTGDIDLREVLSSLCGKDKPC